MLYIYRIHALLRASLWDPDYATRYHYLHADVGVTDIDILFKSSFKMSKARSLVVMSPKSEPALAGGCLLAWPCASHDSLFQLKIPRRK